MRADTIRMPTTNNGIFAATAGRALAFSFAFLFLFLLTLAFLTIVGATPDRVVVEGASQGTPSAPVAVESQLQPAFPIRVVAGAVGLDAAVVNPADTDIGVLDKALLKGAVRYPTSAELGVDGTVLLFGHSSYLPIVNNRAYKTFNDIQNLKEGDTISVYSGSLEYRYRVTAVETANATADAVALPQDGKYLKLVTCNTFGKKEDRFIVSASLVGTYSSVID